MRGHIRKRGKKSWSIVVDVGRDSETGKRKQRWHTIRGTKRDAERALQEMLVALEKGTYVKPTQLTVGEWLKQWYDTYVRMHTTPRTQESYRSIITHHLVPALGAIPLVHLQPQQLQSYYMRAVSEGRADGRGGLSARSVLYHHRILSEALKHAVKMGVASRNVAEVVDPPKPCRVKLNILGPEDVARFLDAARETLYYVVYCVLLYTGLRRGEALALKWKNVDLLGAELHVVESAFKLGDGTYVVKDPKTPHSCRAVALPPSLAVLLREHRKDQAALRVQLGKPLTDNDFVFEDGEGKPLDPNAVTRTFIKLIRRAGLPRMRLHDLRHTHATLMLKAGVHPKVVSERLGHAGVSITLDIYSHVLPGMQEAAAERFDKLLETSSSTSNSHADVSKPLAKGEGTESEPWRIRTADTLIKSQVLFL